MITRVLQSRTFAPAGIFTFFPTAVILPSVTTIVPPMMTPFVTV